MASPVKIYFLGAAGTVTGSKFLIESPDGNILIDCGMFQGLKELRLHNWEPLAFPAADIDLVLLTHGHLDHTGYLPRLVKQGYKNAIIGTSPTLAIATVILLDSAKIHEEDADRANEESYTIHEPALPFYTIEEAEKTILQFSSCILEEWQKFSHNIKYRFLFNGHIIGATFIEMELYGKTYIFSGDIGREKDVLLDSPKRPQWADYVFLESTYGDRIHPEDNFEEVITEAVKQCLENNGTLIIPSFAVERLQTLMFRLWKLYQANHLPNIPIYIDSPMGNRVLQIFDQFHEWHKLSSEDYRAMIKHFKIITHYRDTWKTIDNPRAKIIIAGSGMVTGGRVLTYLRYYLEKPETIVLLVGYQAEGTRGRKLQEGFPEVKIYGKYCKVNAKIQSIESMSAHADQLEVIRWLSEIKNVPEKIFLIHGEAHAADALRLKIKDTYNWQCHIPKLGEVYNII